MQPPAAPQCCSLPAIRSMEPISRAATRRAAQRMRFKSVAFAAAGFVVHRPTADIRAAPRAGAPPWRPLLPANSGHSLLRDISRESSRSDLSRRQLPDQNKPHPNLIAGAIIVLAVRLASTPLARQPTVDEKEVWSVAAAAVAAQRHVSG